MLIDVFHAETATAELDKIAALLHLIQNAVDDELNTKPINTAALEVISTNLSTAYDLTYRLNSELEQVIDAAYHRKTPGD